MVLIVGLGNPGEKYANSRHNVGFMVLDELLQELEPVEETVWQEDKKLQSQIAQIKTGGTKIILAKPQTMMNASGFAVANLASSFQFPASSIWVVHDDLDLPLGKIKIRKGGGTAGHHGLESIVEKLGTADFVRFRLGIGHPAKAGKWEVGGGKLVSENVGHREVERYVLSGFSGKETVEANKMIKKAAKAIEFALESGLEPAMNRFNAK